jgi:hypothetical protein
MRYPLADKVRQYMLRILTLRCREQASAYVFLSFFGGFEELLLKSRKAFLTMVQKRLGSVNFHEGPKCRAQTPNQEPKA